MEFPSIEERQQVGRRRRLNQRDLDRKNQLQHRGLHIHDFGVSSIKKRDHLNSDEFSQGQVSVRIGSFIHGSQRSPARRHPPQSSRQQSDVRDKASNLNHSPSISAPMLFDDETYSQKPSDNSSDAAQLVVRDHEFMLADEQFEDGFLDQKICVDPSLPSCDSTSYHLQLHARSNYRPNPPHSSSYQAVQDLDLRNTNSILQSSVSPYLQSLTISNVNAHPVLNGFRLPQQASLECIQSPNPVIREHHPLWPKRILDMIGSSDGQEKGVNTKSDKVPARIKNERVKNVNGKITIVATSPLSVVKDQRTEGSSQGKPCNGLEADSAVKVPDDHNDDENAAWWNFVSDFAKGGDENEEAVYKQSETHATNGSSSLENISELAATQVTHLPKASLRSSVKAQPTSSPEPLKTEYSFSTACHPGTIATQSSPSSIMLRRPTPSRSGRTQPQNARTDFQALRRPKPRSSRRRQMGNVSSNTEEEVED